MYTKIENYIKSISITPNKSRSSGFGKDLVYLSLSKSYAHAYANNQTSAAHLFGRDDIRNGVLFHIGLNEDNTKHYGGDVWISGFKDEILSNLKDYINNYNYEENYSETQLDNLSQEILFACAINDRIQRFSKTL